MFKDDMNHLQGGLHMNGLSNVRIIEYSDVYGKDGKYIIEMIAMYNSTTITDEEVKNVINSGCYDSRVILMTKEQYETVFDKKLD